DLVEPTVAELWGLAPDPDSDPVEGPEAELPSEVLVAGLAAEAARQRWVPPGLALAFPAGLVSRDRGGREWAGAGFAGGGVLDELEPGAVLAGFAQDARAGLGVLSGDEVTGVVRAFRRLVSWATAGELAAVSELSGRRAARAEQLGQDLGRAVMSVEAELACALTLTQRGAEGLVDRAAGLARLPGTAAALAAGVIDDYRARVIADQLAVLDVAAARRVEDKLLATAAGLTSGQLRAAAFRAAFAVDPAAARRRREQAQRQARVERWREPSGTASLAGRDLPPAGALAADKRIDALARQLKNSGAAASLDQLRASVYVALLTGTPIDELATPAPDPAAEPAGSAAEPGDRTEPGAGAEPGSAAEPGS
ncbi:MAG TPA: DUF222 domain-containing protein, partial [Candidatus Acidoferrales bacterium]|nr:DUF222 domain-containing protein [Candidatus Acidoferrales bacterium]